MMATVLSDTFWLGLVAGAIASLLFFAGLALGMRLALKQDNPAVLLFTSAAVRIALLLWSGSWVVKQGSAAIIGFALAFMLMRFTITALVRPRKTRVPAQWN